MIRHRASGGPTMRHSAGPKTEATRKVGVTDETNEQLDRIEAQLIEMNSKFEWRVFWGVLGALIAFVVLGIVLGIVAVVFLGYTIAEVQ